MHLEVSVQSTFHNMHNIKDSPELWNLTTAHNNPVGISVR